MWLLSNSGNAWRLFNFFYDLSIGSNFGLIGSLDLMLLLLLLLLHEPQLKLWETVDCGLFHSHREFKDSLWKKLLVVFKDNIEIDIIDRLLFCEAVIIIMFEILIVILEFKDLAGSCRSNDLILEQLSNFVAHISDFLHLLFDRRYFIEITLDQTFTE